MSRERIEGLPEDDWRKHDPRFREPQLSRHLALVDPLAGCPNVPYESVEIVLLVERDSPLEIRHRELVPPDLLEASPQVPECTTDLEVGTTSVGSHGDSEFAVLG